MLITKGKRYFAIVFSAGFAIMSFEMLGSRVLAPEFGGSIEVWGALISVFLAGLSVGYAAGGRLADRFPDPRAISWLLLAPAILMIAFPAYGYGTCKALLSLRLEAKWGALLASMLIFFIPCVFCGAIVPFSVKMLSPDISGIGTAAGLVYAYSSAGSIAGTLFTSFCLISWTGVKTSIVINGVVLLAAWAISQPAGKKQIDSSR